MDTKSGRNAACAVLHGNSTSGADIGLSRRAVLTGGVAMTSAIGLAGAAAADSDQDKADFLFVQTADSMTFSADAGELMLRDMGPNTLFFADRPERIAGNMSTEAFIPFWSEGTDSFLSDPPNADLSIFENGELKQVVVELQNPRIDDGNLIYEIKIISGDMPTEGQNVSIFIDVIGMPVTPLSFAGVRRRAYRRAVLR